MGVSLLFAAFCVLVSAAYICGRFSAHHIRFGTGASVAHGEHEAVFGAGAAEHGDMIFLVSLSEEFGRRLGAT